MTKPVRIMGSELGPTPEWIDLTPDLAEQILGRNKKNRNLRWRKVDQFARDIRNGRWGINGSTISFAENGDLLDGQHRVHAVIQAGIPIRTLAVRGLPPEAQETTDLGMTRTSADQLRLRGVASSTAVAAVARAVIGWKSGARLSANNTTASPPEILDAVSADPRITEAAELAARVQRQVPAPAGVLGLAWWLFSDIDADDADEFFEGLTSGANLRVGSPILVLRRRLTANRESMARLKSGHLLQLFIRTWNAFRDGRSLTKLVVETGRDGAKFPVPK